MSRPLIVVLFLIAILTIVSHRSVARQEGADTACATAKECPPDFKAKWVEAGCVCVPIAATRQRGGDK